MTTGGISSRDIFLVVIGFAAGIAVGILIVVKTLPLY